MIKSGNFLALALIVLGGWKVLMGLFVAIYLDGSEAATKAYLGSGTTGEQIDQGILWLVAGVVVGLIAKIARNTTKNSEEIN
ncbi:hypothetical protein J7443_17900 [Tropicibacter sp. R15_0]|uniref:hypothetical protein n=1 Tax=Tropicibacter sp. R15_0 TaxID=2821101 RepID=UPI001ADCA8D1|nr:hypothetical protein [Tropicibacter sp. R15_0]MBO9467121.1 hypothetical protein [Tropicibacter sp. R15_0]